jgi:regulator of protease activity HflC (stomatin/prohibitin superfamily)
MTLEVALDVVAKLSILLALAFFVWVALSLLLRKYSQGQVTVYEHEAGLRYERGRLIGAVPAGRYPTWPSQVEIERVDLRVQSLQVSGQEILTADALPVRVSLRVSYKIVDPIRQKRATVSLYETLYSAAQVTLRARVSALTLEELLKSRAGLNEGMGDAIATQAGDVGVAIVSADVVDVTLVGPAKQAFAEVWKARKEGEAALERARGEVASLRALANAARMLKGNPELMNLRILAALQPKPGAAAPSIILGSAPGLVPVPARAPGEPEAGDGDSA